MLPLHTATWTSCLKSTLPLTKLSKSPLKIKPFGNSIWNPKHPSLSTSYVINTHYSHHRSINSHRKDNVISSWNRKMPIRGRLYGTDSGNGTLLIEGRTESKIGAIWRNHKMKIMAAAGVLGAGILAGPIISAAVIGTLAAGFGTAVWRRSVVERSLLKPIWTVKLEENRQKIENEIGPFEIPAKPMMASDTGEVTEENGKKTVVVRNVFYLQGKHGMAFVRAVGVDEDPPELRKLILSFSNYKMATNTELVLVDNKPSYQIVDSPSFKIETREKFLERTAKEKIDRLNMEKEEFDKQWQVTKQKYRSSREAKNNQRSNPTL